MNFTGVRNLEQSTIVNRGTNSKGDQGMIVARKNS
jgi:hypothetical protein